ncbi:uncharacterized protein F5891DRAFT_1187124 [Suillus fuscotomentosus]|uniref:CCHC-type domain-containing protein n=1 Tax=Suillus fuscotomentosus TaxID=1912939 RepID=A0AAD4E8S1_9AGAM|nr:uncharacterized protein F5891DRAFT_1187124 [Suillus fuscotomentosus]KAG1901670.1 hypothetical protein F5891DRAFT_1187124 [Suillus fuscotomentosus]
MTPPQTPLPTDSNVSHLSLCDTFYKQNIINVEDNVIVETTLSSLAHMEEIENQLAKEPTHIAAPILSQIHIIQSTAKLELRLNDIEDNALKLSCQHIQRRICSLTIQLLPGSFSDVCKAVIRVVAERNTTQVGHLPSAVASITTIDVPPPSPVREDSQPLPIPPPTRIYARKTCKGTVIHGVTKTKSSKGKKQEVIDLTLDPSMSTITMKQPNLSADNFICHQCKALGHRHKNCPQYHCHVCQAQVPGHFSIYCPYTPKKEQFPLVYTDEGFYDALAEWEAREDQKLDEELERAHHEYTVMRGCTKENNIQFHNAEADPCYYDNMDS